MANVNLPDAGINGSKQRRSIWYGHLKLEFTRLRIVLEKDNTDLNDEKTVELWNSRPGRNIAEQAQKGLAACTKLKAILRIIEHHRLTGNPSGSQKMRCTVGMFNGLIKASHFYDVMRSDNYPIARLFPYPATFHWLNTSTTELDPADMEKNTTDKKNVVPENVGNQSSSTAVKSVEKAEHADNIKTEVLVCEEDKEDVRKDTKVASCKRPMDLKASKAAKRAKLDNFDEKDEFKNAIYSPSNKFGEVSSATIAAANARHEDFRAQADREY